MAAFGIVQYTYNFSHRWCVTERVFICLDFVLLRTAAARPIDGELERPGVRTTGARVLVLQVRILVQIQNRTVLLVTVP